MLITKLPQRPFPLFINPNQTGFVKGCYSGASAALLKRGSWVKGKGKGSRLRVKGKGKGSSGEGQGQGSIVRVRVKGQG